MTDTLANYDKVANDAGFQSAVAMALANVSASVLSEPDTTSGHQARVALAIKVLNQGYSIVEICRGVLSNPTVASAVVYTAGSPNFGAADTDIVNAIAAMWSLLAQWNP